MHERHFSCRPPQSIDAERARQAHHDEAAATAAAYLLVAKAVSRLPRHARTRRRRDDEHGHMRSNNIDMAMPMAFRFLICLIPRVPL